MHGTLRPWSLILTLLIAAVGGDAAIAQTPIPASHHAWGRFKPGSWKLVRVVTESYDAGGECTSTSTVDTKTTLMDVNADGVVLQVESTYEVGGKKFQSEPQRVYQKFSGAEGEQSAVFKMLGAGEVTIEGRDINCTIQQVEVTNDTTKKLTKTFYSRNVAPFILRTESSTRPLTSNTPTSETIVETFALDMPFPALGELLNAAHVRAIYRHQKGVSRTLAVTSMDVPGGVVAHSSKESDVQGRLVRRSSLELLEYEAELADEPVRDGRVRLRLFQRLRNRKAGQDEGY